MDGVSLWVVVYPLGHIGCVHHLRHCPLLCQLGYHVVRGGKVLDIFLARIIDIQNLRPV